MGGEVSGMSSSRWCFSHAHEVVQILLLPQGDGGVQLEDSKYILYTFFNLQGALQPAINIVFYLKGVDKSHEGGVLLWYA